MSMFDIQNELQTIRARVEELSRRVDDNDEIRLVPQMQEPIPPPVAGFQVEAKGLNHADRVTVQGGFTIDRDGTTEWPLLEITLAAEAYIFARYELGAGWEEVSGHVVQNAATLPAPDAWFVLVPIAKVEWSSDQSIVASITQYRVGVLEHIEEAAGTVKAWPDSEASIPAGWQLADGTNGSPDLRDRFLVGAGNDYTVGDIGGADTHTHSVNETIPKNHTHGSAVVHEGEGAAVTVMGYHGACDTRPDNAVYCGDISDAGETHWTMTTNAASSLPRYRAVNWIWKL